MTPVILFRKSFGLEKEFEIAKKYFAVYTQRSEIPKNSLVVGRYSVLPYYGELEKDLHHNNSVLINSLLEHQYVADLGNWYEDLGRYSFFTIDLKSVPYVSKTYKNLPWIVKGETNSKKEKWRTHMYANNLTEAVEIANKLMDDGLLSQQKIYFRRFEKLKTFLTGINGQLITNEYRLFCYKDKVLSSGYYWSSHLEEVHDLGGHLININRVPKQWLQNILNIASKHTNFYVVDVAEKENGEWVLVELNEGSMSGLSENNSNELYSGLKSALENE